MNDEDGISPAEEEAKGTDDTIQETNPPITTVTGYEDLGSPDEIRQVLLAHKTLQEKYNDLLARERPVERRREEPAPYVSTLSREDRLALREEMRSAYPELDRLAETNAHINEMREAKIEAAFKYAERDLTRILESNKIQLPSCLSEDDLATILRSKMTKEEVEGLYAGKAGVVLAVMTRTGMLKSLPRKLSTVAPMIRHSQGGGATATRDEKAPNIEESARAAFRYHQRSLAG